MNIFKREFLVLHALVGESNIRSTSLKYLVNFFFEIGEIIIRANLWLFKNIFVTTVRKFHKYILCWFRRWNCKSSRISEPNWSFSCRTRNYTTFYCIFFFSLNGKSCNFNWGNERIFVLFACFYCLAWSVTSGDKNEYQKFKDLSRGVVTFVTRKWTILLASIFGTLCDLVIL